MSAPWWGRERAHSGIAAPARRLVRGEFGKRPELAPSAASAVVNELRARRSHYVPEWNDPLDGDAGGALVELFGLQMSPVLRRLNRLPDKALVEFLQLAGMRPAPPRYATAMVQFAVSPAAAESILIPKGFQLGAPPADDEGDLVVFETQDDHFVTAAAMQKILVDQGAIPRDVTAENQVPERTFLPLGENPKVGDALLLGLAGTTKLTNSLSLGIQIAGAPGAPPPIALGGVAPTPLPVAPVLQWEALVGSRFQPVELVRDETSNLWRSGIVQLRIPRRLTPRNLVSDEPLYWFRLRLIHGGFERPPKLSFIRVNMARVAAVRTIRDEVLEPVGGPESNRMQLRNSPVEPGSLRLVVEATPLSRDDGSSFEVSLWKEVEDLLERSPGEQVYQLDPTTGVVTFGDGTHGAAVPPGFRNVRAELYRVGSGAKGAVARDTITTMLNSAPFVTGATNPLPASGGVDLEGQGEAIRSGPAKIRSGHRAVTVSDYAVMSRLAPGADVRKAHAVAGLHPSFPGAFQPGVVAVFVVPPADDDGPPIPDETALRAVSEYLSRRAAPAGVEVVAAAPTYRSIRAEVGFVAAPAADTGQIIRDTIAQLNRFLHPLTGGDERSGWPFGGTLFHAELVRRLLTAIENIRAIPRLRLVLDGVPQGHCSDVPLGPTELFWPESHQVIPLETEGRA